MMKRVSGSLLMLVAVACAWPVRADAQVIGCNVYGQSCLYDPAGGNNVKLVPPVPVGATTASAGPFCASWVAKSNLCGPPGAADETCVSCTKAGHPIDLTTGNTDIAQTDISVPGLGGGLVLTRIWNSKMPAIQNAFSGMFGVNWRSNYEERLVFSSPDGYLKFAQGGGAVWSFGTAVVGGSFLTYRTAAPANDATTVGTGFHRSKRASTQ